MKKTTRLMSLLLVLVLCLSVLPLGALADGADTGKNGWVYDAGLWFYHDHGKQVYGWKQIGGVWYYFEDAHGYMYSNEWLYDYDDGRYYHFAKNGAMETNKWVYTTVYDSDTNPHSSWRYLLSSGKAARDWQKIGGVWYYFDPNEFDLMATGVKYIEGEGKLYCFKNSGALYTGWKKITFGDENGDSWDGYAYFTSNGAVENGWKKIDGIWYYFMGYEMVTGGPWPIEDSSGIVKYYYFKDSGALYTGWKYFDFDDGDAGYWYFTSNGAVVNAWKQIGGKWYYFDGPWMALGGPYEINGKYYYFNSSGSLYTGWKRFYTNPHEDRYYWMYFTSNGAYANTTKKIGGVWYTFDEDGWWYES